jgi:hypothetical protein
MRAAARSLTQPASRPSGCSCPVVSFSAEADGIAAEFRRKLAALHQRLRPWEMAAAVRALQDERDAAMRALQERRATARQVEKRSRRIHSSPRARLG